MYAETYGDDPTWDQYLEEANDAETSSPQQSLANQKDNQQQWQHCQCCTHTGTMATSNTAVMKHFPVKEIPKQASMPT
eukprot:15346713-Ditylum_brightwellii.AAC.1